jgi:ABC-2 type transport system permease protein
MKKSLALAWLGIRQMLGDPMYLIFLLGMPVMMTWVMGFLPKEMAGLASSGVMVMFVALGLIMGAGVIIEERLNGTWGRLMASPVSRLEIVVGMLIKLFAVSWAQSLILIAAGRFLFGAPWAHFSGPLFAVLGAYILAMTGLGILLAGILKSQPQVQAVSTGIVMVGTMLGGVFFPVNGSKVMETIAKVSPQGWAARGINEVMMNDAGFAAVATPIMWLVGLGLVFLAIGITRIKFE